MTHVPPSLGSFAAGNMSQHMFFEFSFSRSQTQHFC